MQSPQYPANEIDRLLALKRTHILGTGPDHVIDELVKLASIVCEVPISLVSLVEEAKQWFKSTIGLNVDSTDREVAFCAFTILSDDVMEVPDTLSDERFCKNPLVLGAPHIRFYAGVPLITSDGHNIGTLCVIDKAPKKLSINQRHALSTLAQRVVRQIEYHRVVVELSGVHHEMSEKAIFQEALLKSAEESIISTDANGLITSFSPGAERMLGYTADEVIGLVTPELIHDASEVQEHAKLLSQEFSEAIAPGFDVFVYKARMGMADTHEWTYIRKNGSRIRVSLSVTALRRHSGELIGFLGIARDITEIAKTRSDLEFVTDIFNRTSTLAKVGGWQLNLKTNEIYWTKQVYQIHELDEEKLPPLEKALSFYTADSRQILEAAISKSIETGKPWDLELQFVTAKGRQIWVRTQGAPIYENGEISRLIGTFQDISSPKQDQLDLAFLNRALMMLSKCNELLVSVEDEQQLLMSVCRIAVEIGGYRLAWVGFNVDDEYKSVVPKAIYGDNPEYVHNLNLSWSEDRLMGKGPAGKCIRSGRAVVVSDVMQDPEFPVKHLAREYGYVGIAALPIKNRNKVIGFIGLYSAQERLINSSEKDLLQELTDNLSAGIINIRNSAERKRLERALLQVATAVSGSEGTKFFENIVSNLTQVLNADAGYVSKLTHKPELKAKMLFAIAADQVVDNFEYKIPAKFADQMFGEKDICVITKHACYDFPHMSMMRFYPYQAFAGLCLYSAAREQIGLIFVFFRTEIKPEDVPLIESIMRIFASRTSVELLRIEADTIIKEQASFIEKSRDAIVVRDISGTISFWNSAATKLYGWHAHEVIGKNIQQLLKQDQRDYDHAMSSLLRYGEWVGEFQESRKDGSVMHIESHWTLVKDDDGEPKSIFAIKTDVSMRKYAQLQIEHKAYYDTLTDLPNRALLIERLQSGLKKSRKNHSSAALLFIDLDNFKTLNDSYGHDVGDDFLKAVANRLLKIVRESDTVARLGGDEFVVLLDDLGTDQAIAIESANQITKKVQTVLNEPYELSGIKHSSTPSIGVAMIDQYSESPSSVLKDADTAMYRSKKMGKNRITFYNAMF